MKNLRFILLLGLIYSISSIVIVANCYKHIIMTYYYEEDVNTCFTYNRITKRLLSIECIELEKQGINPKIIFSENTSSVN